MAEKVEEPSQYRTVASFLSCAAADRPLRSCQRLYRTIFGLEQIMGVLLKHIRRLAYMNEKWKI